MEIQVELKHIYGEYKVYPVCEKAKLFAEMLGQKTLTHRDIANIKKLGFSVIQVQPKISI